jgi:hypothetical protein
MAVDRIPCGIGVVGGRKTRLTLAVIAHAHGLEDRGGADVGQGGVERGTAGHRRERRGATAEPGDEILFGQPVLRNLEAPAAPGRIAT